MSPFSSSPFSFPSLADRPVAEVAVAPLVPPSGELPAAHNPPADPAVATTEFQPAPPRLGSTVQFTDQPTGVLCPSCHTDMQFAHVMRLKVVACPTCQGFLAQTKDFAGLVAAVRSTFRGVESVRPLQPAELHINRHCPTCDQKMETHPYGGPGSVVVDSCSRCQIVWLDGGELERIERAPGRR